MISNEVKVLTVGELVVERPSRARVFEQFGIDYCCGGKVPLAEACAAGGADVDAVVEALSVSEDGASPEAETEAGPDRG